MLICRQTTAQTELFFIPQATTLMCKASLHCEKKQRGRNLKEKTSLALIQLFPFAFCSLAQRRNPLATTSLCRFSFFSADYSSSLFMRARKRLQFNSQVGICALSVCAVNWLKYLLFSHSCVVSTVGKLATSGNPLLLPSKRAPTNNFFSCFFLSLLPYHSSSFEFQIKTKLLFTQEFLRFCLLLSHFFFQPTSNSFSLVESSLSAADFLVFAGRKKSFKRQKTVNIERGIHPTFTNFQFNDIELE